MASAGAVLAIGGFIVLAVAAQRASLPLLMIGMAVETVGFALVNPSLQSLISRRSPPDRQGEVLGLGQSAASLARILGPLFGVRLFALSPPAPFAAAAGLMAACLLLIIVAVAAGKDYPGAKE
jgi:MFS family permease